MKREILVLFTRFPLAGRAKTRLISRLGAEGAAQLQREMTEHVLARVWPLVKRRGAMLEVRYVDSSHDKMRRWLGNSLRFAAQGEGDLGARMLRATNQAFEAGMESVILIGADCPELDAPLLERAFDSLLTHPLVFGPAKDGGYYLVGLRRPWPVLFQGIAWSTGSVLADSIARSRQLGIEPCLLPELSDVDEPADLPAWEKARQASRSLSVIIPTLNEAEQLSLTLQRAMAGEPAEIIVADGGSRDDTVRIAQSHQVRVVSSSPNRSRQMNAGATATRGETLLFLHADTGLPVNYRDTISDALRQPQVVGGAFRFRIADPFPGRRLIEISTNWRSRWWRMPYGDQALFARRWVFDQLGGFPDLPIMEDYEFVRCMRRLGKLALLNESVVTSGRRWQRLGFIRTTLINQMMILGYHCGVSPGTLAAFYRGKSPRLETRSLDAKALSQNHQSNELI